jgi:hypothetical protein
MRKITHLYKRKCSAALAGRLALFAFWHRSNLTTPLTNRRIFRCSPYCTIIEGPAPRIPSQTDSLRASSHGWASSTRYGDVAHRQVDHFVDRLIGGKNAMIARHLAQHYIDGFNGIGGVNHLTDVLRKGKERDDAREVGPATICSCWDRAHPPSRQTVPN